MQIRHERPMSDLSFQVRAPLKLTLANGRDVAIDQWSLAALHYPEKTDILPKAALLSIPFQGVDIQFPVRFQEGNGEGELIFQDLTGRQRETLAVFYRSILSGKMVGTDDVITSLDTPVDLVPMGETEDEIETGTKGKSPRLLRIIWNIIFYAVLAFVVFGLIGGQILGRLSHVSLKHARVIAPLVELRSTEATYVDRILVAPGAQVRQGQALVRFSNPDRDARLADIRVDVDQAEDEVRAARDALRRHNALRDRARALLLQAHQAAVNARPVQDFFAGRNLDAVLRTKAALDTFDARQDAAAAGFFDTQKTLRSFMDARKETLARLKRDLGIQKSANTAADIVAPVDGTVTQIDVFKDQFLARGTSVLAIEETAPRVVRAWLNEARAAAIHQGMAVNIRFNDGAGTRSVPGTITDITASIDPSISNDFGIIVTVSFDNLDVAETRTLFRPDAPVIVRAVKAWAFKMPWEE